MLIFLKKTENTKKINKLEMMNKMNNKFLGRKKEVTKNKKNQEEIKRKKRNLKRKKKTNMMRMMKKK